MRESNLAYKKSEIWYLKEWNYITGQAKQVFNLSESETLELYNSTTARIIATIPFSAKCEEPERTAVAHIVLYLTELRGFHKFCNHQQSDDSDIFNRLNPISNFIGGDFKIIEHGMIMLALIMLDGYKASSSNDKINGIYNPISNGVWDYRKIKNQLLNKLSLAEDPQLDTLFFDTLQGNRW